MKIAAIISEYNPLHNGHKYHIEKTKEELNCDYIICIMSGNFVQRGLPAYIDKWNRAEMALLSGVDLVIELPVIFSLSSAEFFAKGAVEILDSLGIVNYLSFGSEIGDTEPLKLISSVLCEEPNEYKYLLKNHLSSGLPFTKARTLALIEYMNNNSCTYDSKYLMDISNSSNNILAIEYLKTLFRINSSIIPFTIKRQGANYNDENLNKDFSSATAIRNYLKSSSDLSPLKNHIPSSSYKIIENLTKRNYKFAEIENIFPFIKYKSLTDEASLKNIPEASEGLYNKVYKTLWNSENYHDAIKEIKSKRYTYTRISRLLCQYYIGFENYPVESLRRSNTEYIRVLGFNSRGSKLLKEIKNKSNIKIHTKIPKELCPMLKLDMQSTRAYSMLNPSVRYNEDYFQRPRIIE
ncbi:nucleotidyltransferase [Clostridium amazonitimonense]|uniref:nucleotidyltransferase n=1 Tax=Clostridium amazonitimonense TaxID=1499689 RepID=UPI000509F318|nr:nucleotidyltransferase [Clostridium amazonitimonense]